MKILITVQQLRRILETELIKLPIVFKVGNLTKEDLEELTQLLKEKY